MHTYRLERLGHREAYHYTEGTTSLNDYLAYEEPVIVD